MRKPSGYGVATSRDGKPFALWFDPARSNVEIVRSTHFETDTFCCGHCNRIVRVKPKEDPANVGGLCKCCMRLICKFCVGKSCDPLEEKLKRSEDRDRFRRSLSL